jgi:hypothetical protein
MTLFTEKTLWDIVINAYVKEEQLSPILPDTTIVSLFGETKEEFYDYLENITKTLHEEYRFVHVVLELSKEEANDLFETIEEVFLYFYLKIEKIYEIAEKIRKNIKKDS